MGHGPFLPNGDLCSHEKEGGLKRGARAGEAVPVPVSGLRKPIPMARPAIWA